MAGGPAGHPACETFSLTARKARTHFDIINDLSTFDMCLPPMRLLILPELAGMTRESQRLSAAKQAREALQPMGRDMTNPQCV